MEKFFSRPVAFDELAPVVALSIKTIWACHIILNIKH